MQAFIHHSHSHSLSLSLVLRNPSSSAAASPSSSLSAMSSSLTLLSFSPIFANSPPRRLSLRNHHHQLPRSRVFASLSTGSQVSLHDASFADYKVSSAFLFPGQVHFSTLHLFKTVSLRILIEKRENKQQKVLTNLSWCDCRVHRQLEWEKKLRMCLLL